MIASNHRRDSDLQTRHDGLSRSSSVRSVVVVTLAYSGIFQNGLWPGAARETCDFWHDAEAGRGIPLRAGAEPFRNAQLGERIAGHRARARR